MEVVLHLCELLVGLAFTEMLQQSNSTILYTYLPFDQHPPSICTSLFLRCLISEAEGYVPYCTVSITPHQHYC